MAVFANPAEPATDDGSYGGYTDIAKRLDKGHPDLSPHSRQLVARWYAAREWNGFPERIPVRYKNGKVRWHFKLTDVEAWYARFRETRQRRPRRPPPQTPRAAYTPHPADSEVTRHEYSTSPEDTRSGRTHARAVPPAQSEASREHPRGH